MKVKDIIDVLVIEDNKTVQYVIMNLLNESSFWHFNIETCETLSEAYKNIKTYSYDIVLSDLELPDSTRDETLQSLKNNLKDLPFVILTSTDTDELLLQSIEAGAQDYICKDHIKNGPLLSRSIYYAVQHWEMQQKLEFMASHDSLTNTYTKRFFLSSLESVINLAERYGDPFCLCICDLDDFREVNNKYGHVTGDKVLIEFVKALSVEVRESDILGRFGGDEFCIIFQRLNKKECKQILSRLGAIRIGIPIGKNKKKETFVSASFGGIEFKKGLTAEKMLIKADKSLYKVKDEGKGFSIIS